jgi:AcrR family transcriptional regulator
VGKDPRSGPEAGSRTQAERRATTEQRLLEAAHEIVAEEGVRAVTTAAVGRRAGYSRGIVNHHFGSRAAMMVRLAEEAQSRFAPSPEGRRGREHVLSVVGDYLGMLHSRPQDLRVFLRLWSAAVGDEEPSLRCAFAERDAAFRDYFEAAIAEGVAEGTIRADIDGAATAVGLVGMVRGIAMQVQIDPGLLEGERLREAAVALVDHSLRGAR